MTIIQCLNFKHDLMILTLIKSILPREREYPTPFTIVIDTIDYVHVAYSIYAIV